MLKYTYETFTLRNTRAVDKPNEDLVIFNRENGIGLLLDGVSRDKENGIYPNPSPALIASQLFSDTVISEIMSNAQLGIEGIQSAILAGNKRLQLYNRELGHRFPAGTVGIVFTIENNRLHYGYIGDCYAGIIRNGMMRVFTECQTRMVAEYHGRFSSDEIRFEICNHISHPCGYGVWDGNCNAMDFVNYGTINLDQGDILLIYTDGLEKEISGKNTLELASTPLDILAATESDYNKDDRTCIRLIFEDEY